MVWQALILYKIAWNFNMLLVITISNSLGKIIQFEPSLYIKPLVAIAYFVIPTLSGVICCGGKQRKLARKNFALSTKNKTRENDKKCSINQNQFITKKVEKPDKTEKLKQVNRA